jgi:hypothetical protein
MTEEILWLWFFVFLAQAICLLALAKRRLVRRYPVFFAFVAFGLAHSAFTVHSLYLGGAEGETVLYRWLLIGMYGAVAIEACVAQARHFRSLFSFAIGAIVVFAVLSAALGGTIAFVGTDILLGRGPVVLMATACCILLILSTAFFSTFPVTMRFNVRWHVLILQILLASEAVATGLGSVGSPGWHLASEYVATCCPLICYLLWTFKLTPSGECFMPLSEIPAEVLAKLMARDQPPPDPPRACRRPHGPRGAAVCRHPGPVRWKAETTPSEPDLGA